MTVKVRVEKGTVVEVLPAPPEGFTYDECYHEDVLADCVDAPDDTQQGWTRNGNTFVAPPEPAPVTTQPRTVFTPREVIETLFTPIEQQAIFTAAQTSDGWQIAKFIALVTATPSISITDPEFIADIGAVEKAGLLTADRAAEVLAGEQVS